VNDAFWKELTRCWYQGLVKETTTYKGVPGIVASFGPPHRKLFIGKMRNEDVFIIARTQKGVMKAMVDGLD
jgi:hypothetical protein